MNILSSLTSVSLQMYITSSLQLNTEGVLLAFLNEKRMWFTHFCKCENTMVCVSQDDCLLKVWYPTTGWKSAVVMPDMSDKRAPVVHFSFVYLAHPRTVTGFSWRKTSKYMPKCVGHWWFLSWRLMSRVSSLICACLCCRGSVCNVLLTSCADGICRVWSETLLPEDSLLGGQISENSTSFSSSLPNIAQKDKIQHALEVGTHTNTSQDWLWHHNFSMKMLC